MSETLLSASNVLLFGRVVEDLQIRVSPGGDRGGTPGQLEQQLQAKDANFARIYGFAFEGLYRVLPRPALFLVHGAGLDAGQVMARLQPPQTLPTVTQGNEKAGGGPDLPGHGELKVWSYDKADYSIRLDMHTGGFEQLLLEPSAALEARGMSVQGMSVQGMSARGMSTQGMSAQGMSAQGMRLRGMSTDSDGPA